MKNGNLIIVISKRETRVSEFKAKKLVYHYVTLFVYQTKIFISVRGESNMNVRIFYLDITLFSSYLIKF